MTQKSGPLAAVSSVVEGAKGVVKQVIGLVTGNQRLADEAKAQQDKADAQREVAKREAEAESARGGAKAAAKRQKANQ